MRKIHAVDHLQGKYNITTQKKFQLETTSDDMYVNEAPDKVGELTCSVDLDVKIT